MKLSLKSAECAAASRSQEGPRPPRIKRYLIFQGDNYYPTGGWLDFVGSRETLDDAIIIAQTLQLPRSVSLDWWFVVDLELGVVVKSSDSDLLGLSGALEYHNV